MKRWIHASTDNKLSQNEFAAELIAIKRNASSMIAKEIFDSILDVIQNADTGVSMPVDNRVLSGFRGNSGSAYEFRKIADNKWKEIFDDFYDVSDKKLADMYVKSRGFKRASR